MVCMVQVQAYLLLQTKSNFFDWQERIANQRDVSKCKIWSFICIKMCIMYAGIVLIIGLIYVCGPRWIITCLKCGRHLFRFLISRSCIIYIWLLLFWYIFRTYWCTTWNLLMSHNLAIYSPFCSVADIGWSGDWYNFRGIMCALELHTIWIISSVVAALIYIYRKFICIINNLARYMAISAVSAKKPTHAK